MGPLEKKYRSTLGPTLRNPTTGNSDVSDVEDYVPSHICPAIVENGQTCREVRELQIGQIPIAYFRGGRFECPHFSNIAYYPRACAGNYMLRHPIMYWCTVGHLIGAVQSFGLGYHVPSHWCWYIMYHPKFRAGIFCTIPGHVLVYPAQNSRP
jgi:hypothetical protein